MPGHIGRADGMRIYGACVLGASMLFACGASQLGASEADVARARGQSPPGAEVFSNECARCHGPRGEGLAGAPYILGPGALPTYPRDYSGTSASTDPVQLQIQQQTRPAGAPRRDPFRTASDLYAYVHNHLPKSRAASMHDKDYWDVVSFMLVAQGVAIPQGGLNAENGSTVSLPAR